MILIGENIHIISPVIRTALLERNESVILSLLDKQKAMDFADLNVGPAKGELSGIMPWLCDITEKNSTLGVSLDTTNAEEMAAGLMCLKNPSKAFINSTSNDAVRFEKMTDLALEFKSNLVALTLCKDRGIPKTADGRLEIAFEMYENALAKGIAADKLYFDPLVLPVSVDQPQGLEVLATIKMIKESFDPPVKTVIGLSNISNGSPSNLRPLINKVFGVLAFGAGLDAVIADAGDAELIRIFKMIESGVPEKTSDSLYLSLVENMSNFPDFDNIEYDAEDVEQSAVMKTVDIIFNRKIYSHSFTLI